ncbi:MAG: cbb3-type cytochrome c oxidase subunit I, partial [Actinobacteria bacterium]|nr:cbb3-type cytochrome c oxidase subunit I [Actinomycetota bacterium]
MALTETRPETEGDATVESARPTPGALERLLGSGDHVAIGRLYIGFALAFTTLSLTLLAATGLDLLTDNGILGTRTAQLAASARVGVLFLGVVPLLLGIAIAIVPLQLGSPAIAFPRAAALSFWTWLVSAGIFVTSAAIDGGFLGEDTTAAKLGNVAFGALLVSLGLGAVCVATTVISHRPLGMRLAYVPGLAWASLVGSAVWLVTLGAGFAHVVIAQIGRMGATELATNFSDGLIWMFRGPTVFVFAIPVLGIAVDVVASATGRRFGRPDAVQL